jgi:hypothetical protein
VCSTCSVFRTIVGLEVRCSYASDDLIFSQYAVEIETARAIAIDWKTAVELKGFHRNRSDIGELPSDYLRVFAPMPRWSKRTRLQSVQFEWENGRQLRVVRLTNASVQAGDPVRVAVAGVEVKGCIEAVESSTLCVRIGRRLL